MKLKPNIVPHIDLRDGSGSLGVLKNAYTQQNFLRTHIVAWIKELFSLKVDFHVRFH